MKGHLVSDVETRDIERLWAYVHGELDAEQRAAVKLQLAQDDAFRQQAEALFRADGWLRDAARAATWSDEMLVDRALAAMDAEASAAGGAGGEVIEARTGFGRALWRAVAGVAAAAALLLVVWPRVYVSGVRFAPAEVVGYQARGDAASAPVTSALESQANRCWELLEQAIQDAAQAKGIRTSSRLTLTFRYQALAGDAFSIRVRAVDRQGVVVDEWSGEYSGQSAFLEQVGQSANVIAEDLREPRADTR